VGAGPPRTLSTEIRMNTSLVMTAAATVALALTHGPSGQGASASTQEPEVEPKVELEFLADAVALDAGGELLLAAYFELPEHWHVYWENAGQSGMPTIVKVTGPEGFEVGDPRFPGPKSLEVNVGITSFVHEESVAIFVPIQVPEELDPAAEYTFELEAEWLVCKTECYLQEGKRSLSLKPHRGEGAPAKANAAKLDPQKELLPRPQAELEGLRYQWMASPPDYRALTVVRGATETEFFPSLESNLTVSGVVHNPGLKAYEMAIDFSTTPGQEQDEPLALGVFRVVTREGTRFYSVNFSKPAK